LFANVVYCAAYVPDLFAQFSGFADQWRQYRWVLLGVGCTLGAIITRAIVTSALHL
jgi:hypothetical protein